MEDISGGTGDAGIEHRFSEYLDTYVEVGLAGGRVISVEFTDEPRGEEPDEGEGTEPLEAISEYLRGKVRSSLDVPYALTVTGIERRALESTQDVPFGATVRYDNFASSIGEEDVPRVREALEGNPVPIVLPSHRVVRSNEEVGGGGTNRTKELLLRLEE